MPTNSNAACPTCSTDEDIQVQTNVWQSLTASGMAPVQSGMVGMDGDDNEPVWDGDSPAMCAGCGFMGTADDFGID